MPVKLSIHYGLTIQPAWCSSRIIWSVHSNQPETSITSWGRSVEELWCRQLKDWCGYDVSFVWLLSCLHNPNVSSQASAFEKCREPTFSANPSPTKYLIFRLFFFEKREISFFWFLHVFFCRRNNCGTIWSRVSGLRSSKCESVLLYYGTSTYEGFELTQKSVNFYEHNQVSIMTDAERTYERVVTKC